MRAFIVSPRFFFLAHIGKISPARIAPPTPPLDRQSPTGVARADGADRFVDVESVTVRVVFIVSP